MRELSVKTPKHRLIAVRVLLVLVPLVAFIAWMDRWPGKDRVPWQASMGFLGYLTVYMVAIYAATAIVGSAKALLDGWIEGGSWRKAKARFWGFWNSEDRD
jgi:hypothetical protein